MGKRQFILGAMSLFVFSPLLAAAQKARPYEGLQDAPAASGPMSDDLAREGSLAREELAPREIRPLRLDLVAFRKNMKAAANPMQLRGAIFDLLSLHHELVAHPRFLQNAPLQSLRAQTSTALRTAGKQLERFARQSTESSTEDGMHQGAGLDAGASREADASSRYRFDDLTYLSKWNQYQCRLAADWWGGPLSQLGDLPGNFAPPFTDQELIQLIETTIHPDFWRRNGGEGVIEYYDPALVLIVNGSMQVHDEIYDLLRLLR